MSETSAKRETLDENQQAAGETPNDDEDDDEDDALGAALFADEDADAEDDAASEPAPTADDEVPTAEPEPVAPVSDDQGAEQEDAAEQDLEQDQDQDNNVRREDHERTRIIMGLMTEEQIDRYEAYRRSGLSGATLKKALQAICGHNVGKNMVTVVRGLAKVYVGEIVETASLIAHEHGEKAPLQPIHYRMAYQQLHLSGKVPHQTANKKLRL